MLGPERLLPDRQAALEDWMGAGEGVARRFTPAGGADIGYCHRGAGQISPQSGVRQRQDQRRDHRNVGE